MAFNFMSKVAINKPRHSNQDLSNTNFLSFDFGQLVPFHAYETIPNSYFHMESNYQILAAPMVAPQLSRCNVFMYWFYFPYRCMCRDWDEQMRGGKDGDLVVDAPYIALTPAQYEEWIAADGSLGDYLGFPKEYYVESDGKVHVNAFPFSIYNCIYNNYFKDARIDEESPWELHSGLNTFSEFDLQNGGPFRSPLQEFTRLKMSCWEKDYFTAALQHAQAGSQPVKLPMSGDAQITFDNRGGTSTFDSMDKVYLRGSGTDQNPAGTVQEYSRLGAAGEGRNPKGLANENMTTPLAYDNSAHLKVDLSNVNAATINDLRWAMSLQKFLELANLTGPRPYEFWKGMFGTAPTDLRLQLPHAISHSIAPLDMSEVLQNSASTENSPLGTPAGRASGFGVNGGFGKYFVQEYGIIMGFIRVMPRTAYQQGLPRWLFPHRTRDDFYFPQFDMLGEQPIYTREIYGSAAPDKQFGYLPAFSHYRTKVSEVHGDFRSSLDKWHMGRIFENEPTLNSEFIHYDPDNAERIFAVTDHDYNKLWCKISNKFYAKLPMSKTGMPTF